MLAVFSLSLLVSAAPAAPDWDGAEVKGLVARSQAAARTPSLQAQNRALLELAAAAYRATIAQGDIEAAAKRILRGRVPDHPNVKEGQWLDALMRRFYDDLAERCRVLARFARDRHDRVFFERMTEQARGAADQLSRGLELRVEGLDGYSAPLAVVDGEEPYPFVSKATVEPSGAIDVDGMERVRFVGHRPPAGVERTEGGAIRRLVAAFQFFERSARSLGNYDRTWRKKRGHVRAVVPARFPAAYLNEIARAARQAKMRTLHVMVMTKRGELRELAVQLGTPRRFERTSSLAPVTCADDIPMSLCAERIAYAKEKGQPYWGTSESGQ